MGLGLEMDGGGWVALSAATVLLWNLAISAGADTLAIGEVIRTNQTLTSSDDTFALGFFDSGNSTHHLFHLAVWYARIPGQTVIWVAYRNSSLTDPALKDGEGRVVWQSFDFRSTLCTTGKTDLVEWPPRPFSWGRLLWAGPRLAGAVHRLDGVGAEVEERLDYRGGFGVSGVQWDDVVFEGRGHVSHCYLR